MGSRVSAVLVSLLLHPAAMASAQDRAWVVEGTLGYAGFVDDATKNYWAAGGSLRRYVTPRLSIGPELVLMHNSALVTDRQIMATGNITFDAYRANAMRLTPFVVGGFGVLGTRDQVRDGPFWSSDPAFTVGGGVRAAAGERVSAAAEYRLGWGLHHRLTGSVGFHW
jgi:hypothetical protein